MNFLLTLFLALSVKQDQAPLRAGCSQDSTIVATLAAGTPLELRYLLAGETVPCYKVKATIEGQLVEGYLPASSMEGLESFDKARRDAPSITLSEVLKAANRAESLSGLSATRSGPATSANTSIRGVSRVLVAQAQEYIESNQPNRALALLEPELEKHKDSGLLALAGVAAWRADQSRRALEYWRNSLDISPNPELEALYKRVEGEISHDQSGEKLFGVRVVLRYESGLVSVETARQMLAAVDGTFARVSSQLGCNTDERIVTIIQSRDAYQKGTNAAEWSGGLFDGRIRMPASTGQTMNAQAERALAHETTHACMSLLGQWPAWLQEGMAQKLSGDILPPAAHAKLAELAHDGKLPHLEDIRQDWSRLDAEHAQLAYALALAAVDSLYEKYGNDGVRNLMKNPERLAVISADLDKRLGL